MNIERAILMAAAVWLLFARERRNKIRLERKHLDARARRFLKGYLEADEEGKPRYYLAVEEISRKCRRLAR